ncbi:hypothetical protein GTY65_16075 [Streptomyces sp. SID8379]|uniref:hypothetical protein n=1 Tax=unclassified Streptomyces TaxID=2593676 RepID=UPI00037953AA|nr:MULTISPECIES: hypothetical protein [unclassified Streptomyces]MYW65563.1 hypothetical protein [Streptomyces sp. SID8379]
MAGKVTPHVPHGATHTVTDRNWAHELRAAALCSLLLLGLVTLIDAANETLSPVRGLLWTGLSLLLYAVLHPPRVMAGPGRLAVHGLLRRRHVCTDLLVSVRRGEGLTPRLVLRDALGARVELDPAVLVANPVLWHRVETGAGRARASGLLVAGEDVLRELGARVDGDEARAIFSAAGLS